MKALAKAGALDLWRQTGDPPADALIHDIVARQGTGFLRQLMPYLSDYKQPNFASLDPFFEDFYKKYAHLPADFKRKEVSRATDFYANQQHRIGLILGCYSLPYCYLGEDGARVLCMSERIHKDTYNRLLETGQFLRRVMTWENWENGDVLDIILKVRMLHAIVRYFTLHSGRWELGWGVPINQEDMAGTNLAFSLIVLRGLRHMGVPVDAQTERAYLLTWRYIGQLLGVDPAMLPADARQAVWLDRHIAARQFRASEAGQQLTQSLMTCYDTMTGSQLAGEFFRSQSRLMLGDTHADMLGIPPTRFPKSLLAAFNKTNSFLTTLFG